MRCHICDAELSENEIQLDEDLKPEPCTTCLKIIMDTAYSDGFEPSEEGSRYHNTLLEEESEDVA